MKTTFGHRQGLMLNGVWTMILSSKAALAAVDAGNRQDGDIAQLWDGSRWRFVSAGTATDSTSLLVLAPAAGTGCWVRINDVVDLGVAVTFANTDAQVLITLPTNAILSPRRGYWKVSTSWTGGASSAIGLSSSNASYSTKGDLLGGASGDVAAALTSGAPVRPGTIGAKTAAGVFLVGGDTIRFDRVTSAFTAGVGEAHLICDLLANPGL